MTPKGSNVAKSKTIMFWRMMMALIVTFIGLLSFRGALTTSTVDPWSTDCPKDCPGTFGILRELQALRQLVNQETRFRITLEAKLQDFEKILPDLKQQQQWFPRDQDTSKEEMLQNNKEFMATFRPLSEKVENFTSWTEDLQGRILTLSDGLKQLEIAVQNLSIPTSEKGTHVAFSASDAEVTPNGQLAFRQVLLNIGGGYQPENGTFIAPEDGTYTFHWTTVTHGKTTCDTALLQNDRMIQMNLVQASTLAEDLSGSQSVILKLHSHDTVQIRPHWTCNRIHGHYSTFTGHQL